MTHRLARHFTPQLLRSNIRTTSINRGSEYPTRSPYDIPASSNDPTLITVKEEAFKAFDSIVQEAANMTPESLAYAKENAEEITRHHFNTYRIVQDLEAQGFSKEQAVVIMKGMKFKLRESIAKIHQDLLLKSDLENESYLFSAAVSELRTEIQVMRQKDTQTLKAETQLVTRDVDALAQRIREDMDRIKNEIALDMDNRKNETRSEQKEIDMTIQELNSKFTVKLGEVRTGLETTRWETIWKGLVGVAGSSIMIATVAYFLTNFAEKRAEDQKLVKQKKKKQLQEDARSAGLVDMEVVY